MTDQELIHSLKQNSPAAFATLMSRYRARVVNTCYGFTRQKQDAEDVAQEVFLEVYKSIHQFNEKVPLWVWLYRLAVNKSVDFLRSASRVKRRWWLKKLFGDEPFHLKEIADDTGPLRNIENEELRQILDSAVQRLPARQRSAFVLSRHEGLSNAQVAKVMDVSEGAVESLITRANQGLRKLLKHYYDTWK